QAHQEAFDILVENRDVLDSLVLALFEKETLDKDEVAKIFQPLRKREPRPAWTGSDNRQPSALPPVRSPKELNGTTADDEGTIILAPGSEGDVHGGGSNVSPGKPPEPKSPGA